VTPLLQVDGVTKRFGGLTVLRSVRFDVPEGSIIGLIGPNGSGKTTMFNVITGYLQPEAGRVLFRGRTLTGQQPDQIARAGIARTFQLVRPFAGLSTTDNVATAVLYGRGERSVAAARREGRRWLAFAGLADALDAPVASLTLAGKKRLELARALATGPSLLLLDEVFAGLNPAECDGAVDLVRRIRDEMGLTVLLVEHVIKVVMHLCERVVVLGFGETIAEGAPADIQAHPDVRRVYLGEGYDAAG
jgi:branched-chain amino acid transport system ATP-binding protein